MVKSCPALNALATSDKKENYTNMKMKKVCRNRVSLLSVFPKESNRLF